MEAHLAEEEDARQKLQLEKVAVEGKVKKLEEDVLLMEDQNNKLQKVFSSASLTTFSHTHTHTDRHCLVSAGAQASGGEDRRHELQPGRGGGEVQEPDQTQGQTRVHDLRPGGSAAAVHLLRSADLPSSWLKPLVTLWAVRMKKEEKGRQDTEKAKRKVEAELADLQEQHADLQAQLAELRAQLAAKEEELQGTQSRSVTVLQQVAPENDGAA